MIKHNGKICIEKDCTGLLFAKKLCKYHYSKKNFKPLKQAKIKPKAKKIKFNDFGFDTQLEMFQHLWLSEMRETGSVTCKISGKDITRFNGTQKFLNCFAHILPKGMFGKFKLNPENMMLVHPDVHHLLDHCTEEDREKHPSYDWYKFYEKQSYLKSIY